MLSRAKGSISSELFQTIVRQTGKRAIFLNLYFQGEPFINTELINLFQIASGKRLFISCATNAHYINENNVEGIVSSGVDQLIISFDGTTQESYQKYRRGGDFNKVLKAIKVLVDEKKRQSKKFPLLVLQFLILKHNEENISEAKEMFKELKADKLVFKTAQLYNLTVSNEFLPENSKNSRYKIKPDGTISINGYSKNKCWKSWSTCVITWDGNVVPCCFDKNADHCYGNILNNNFRTIMLNKTTRDFKKEILQNRKNIDICSNCSQT
jgi:radical SAM protein with 4Fe4S-binding SPASM domain